MGQKVARPDGFRRCVLVYIDALQERRWCFWSPLTAVHLQAQENPLKVLADDMRANNGVEWRPAILLDKRVEFMRGKDFAAYLRAHEDKMHQFVAKCKLTYLSALYSHGPRVLNSAAWANINRLITCC